MSKYESGAYLSIKQSESDSEHATCSLQDNSVRETENGGR